MTKHKVLTIDYCDKFKCIGNACEDHCCKGWTITVDKNTYNKYKKIPQSEFKNKLNCNINRNRKSINDYDYGKVNLVDKKCPMLTEDRLCEVYMNLGEEYMCYTCRTYPRIYNKVDDIIEKSLGVSCIEAARNILLRENPIEFNLDVEDVEELKIVNSINTTKGNNISERFFYHIRSFAIDIIQDRRFTIEHRLAILGLFINQISSHTQELDVVRIIDEYISSINGGGYDNLMSTLIKEDKFDAQLEFLTQIYKIIMSKKISSERYLNNFENIVNSLQLNSDEAENIKASYVEALNNHYRPFVKKYQYIYENYLVNYMFKTMFPATKKSLLYVYINLVVQFSILKMNIIGICGYYKEDMDTEKILNLIQSYAAVTEHNSFLADNIHNYLERNNLNTLAHVLILMGK